MGLAVYASLRGGAGRQGTQNALSIIPRAGVRVLLHEAGHVLEQRARDTDENILWKNSVAKTHDNISVLTDPFKPAQCLYPFGSFSTRT
jgi:capsid protein